MFRRAQFAQALSIETRKRWISNWNEHVTPQAPQVFDRKTKRIQKNRASLLNNTQQYDYLKDEVASRLVDRVMDTTRNYPVVLDIGCGYGHISNHIDSERVQTIIEMDMAEKMLRRDSPTKRTDINIMKVAGDEEYLPIRDNSVDAVLSSLSLHWVNDLPGALIQAQRVLKPDCPFIGCIFGGDTLFELRSSLQVAQQEREGGISPHISPFADVRDLGGLLSRAGFTLTTVDIDNIVVNYPSCFELIDDLKAMGENNAIFARKPLLRRETLIAAASVYKDVYGNMDGSIPATFQIFYMIGWKKSDNQPQPKERGSATVSFQTLQVDPSNK